MTDKINVLLIEDNPGDIRLLREMLAEVKGAVFNLEVSGCLHAGLERLNSGEMDIVLLDLSLPDSDPENTLVQAHAYTEKIPIVVLTGFVDEKLAIDAIRNGAQDYLVKGEVTSELLGRSLRYAIERQRLQAELRSLSLTDELTGLDNRRGFLASAKQQLKLAPRTQFGISLLLADLDGLKQINDRFGHLEGDQALMDTANVLRETFREPDIIARLGGDEFGVLAVGTSEAGTRTLTARLQRNLEARNASAKRTCRLSLSIGAAYYDPESKFSVQTLLALADKALYAQKRSKRNAV